MDEPTARGLARLARTKAKRLARDLDELRRLVAQLDDALDTEEDTSEHHSQEETPRRSDNGTAGVARGATRIA